MMIKSAVHVDSLDPPASQAQSAQDGAAATTQQREGSAGPAPLALVGVVFVLLAIALFFAERQDGRGDPLAPAPAWSTFEGFISPGEQNRWLRAGDQLPRFETLEVGPGGSARVTAGNGRFVLRSEDGGLRWSVVPAQAPVKAASSGWIASAIAETSAPPRAMVQQALPILPDARQSKEPFEAQRPLPQQNARALPPAAAPELPTPASYRILAKTWIDRARGSALAVGEDGVILRTENGGGQWTELRKAQGQTLRSVKLLPDATAVLVLAPNTVLRGDGVSSTWREPVYRKSPAPWFWAVLGFVALAAVGAAIGRLQKRGRTVQAREGVLEQAVSDAPVDDPAKDRLSFLPAVEALSRFLRHSGTQPPLALAVNARWGMGKSSFMWLLWGDLRKRGARPVWFNVWHHQHEEVLLAPLLQAVTRQGIPRFFSWHGIVFRARLVAERWRTGGWAMLMGVAALLTLPAYAICLVVRTGTAAPGDLADRFLRDAYGIFTQLTVGSWLAGAGGGGPLELFGAALRAIQQEPRNTLVAVLVVLLVGCWTMLLRFLLRPFPASPAVLLSGLGSKFTVQQAQAQTDFRRRFRVHFGEVSRALGSRAMTIFIDDLDRCRPEKAAELLECVNYLCEAGRCFVILGTDRRIVEAQVASAHKALAEEQAAVRRAENNAPLVRDAVERDRQAVLDRLGYARVYLRKLVQLDVKLPTLETERALDMLLGPKASAAAGVQEEQGGVLRQKLQAARARIGMVAATLAAVLVLAGLGWQVRTTAQRIDEEQKQAASEIKRRLDQARASLEDARAYEHWMKARAGLGNPDAMLLASLRARSDSAQAGVKAMEQAIQAMETEALAGRPDRFTTVLKTRFDPLAVQMVAMSRGDQPDAQAWPGRSVAAASTPPRPDAAARAGSDGQAAAQAGAGGNGGIATANTQWWPAVLTMAIVLAVLAWGWSHQEVYEERPSDGYRQAVKKWQQQLLQQPETATPRELKRFLNISRYAVVRLRKGEAQGGRSTKSGWWS